MEIIYINLDSRTDRKEEIEKVLQGFSFRRLAATKHEYPFVGCVLSHIRALQLAIQHSWEYVLIMEDDMQWNNFEKNYPVLQELLTKPFDVIVLGGILVSHDPQTHKLFKCNSTGAYVVHRNYYQTLLDNFGEGYNLLHREIYQKKPLWGLKKIVRNDGLYRIDIYWHRLQARDNWFILPLCYSPPGFSDISGVVIDWSSYFLKE